MSSPLKYGDPADENDFWLRVLTNKNYVKKGQLHHSALRGTALRPPREGKQWSHELSGRLLSLAKDVRAEGEAYVAKVAQDKTDKGEPPSRSLVFMGVAHASVKSLRGYPHATIKSDARYTPLLHDDAHSDFVVFGAADDDLDPVRDWLQEILKVAVPAEANSINAPQSAPGTAVPIASGTITVA